MSVTDLTGTKWLMNDTVSISSGLFVNINFQDDELNEYIGFEMISGVNYYDTPTTRIFAYNIYNGWNDEKYKTITFTDGEGVTNSSLISWLEANATQIIPPVPYLTNDQELTSIADAIRSKAGTSASLTFPSGFVSAIENIPSGGGSGNIDELIMRTLSGYFEGSMSHIGSFAFAHCDLTSVYFPNVQTIEQHAFSWCTHLHNANFPLATSIGDGAFSQCGLSSVYFPNLSSTGQNAFFSCGFVTLTSDMFPALTHIGYQAFRANYALRSINLPDVVSVGSYAFVSCSGLSVVSLPKATYLGSNAFSYCYLPNLNAPLVQELGAYALPYYSGSTLDMSLLSKASNYTFTGAKLTDISFPALEIIGTACFQSTSALTVSLPLLASAPSSAFASCYSLQTVYLPECSSVGAYAFSNCTTLKEVRLIKCTFFGSYAFASCWSLSSLNLAGVSSVPFLSGPNVFYRTPLSSAPQYTGISASIYVPASLYSEFIVASYWSDMSLKIVSVQTD